MGKIYRRMLLGIISVLMIALITSTATTTVAAGDWGNLRKDDEMRWLWYMLPEFGTEYQSRITVEVLDISGTSLTYRWAEETVNGSILISQSSGIKTVVDHTYPGWIFSQSHLKQMIEAETAQYKQHNWHGTNYRTYYYKGTSDGYFDEIWVDRETGILLEWRYTTGEGTYTFVELLFTNAQLTKVRSFCLGTMLITLVSVATLVSFAIATHQKKKKP